MGELSDQQIKVTNRAAPARRIRDLLIDQPSLGASATECRDDGSL